MLDTGCWILDAGYFISSRHRALAVKPVPNLRRPPANFSPRRCVA
jgi:hypothetical protein